MALLREEAGVTPVTVEVTGDATQPKDDLVLAAALSGGASHLVTRDRAILRLSAYRDLVMISPGAAQQMLPRE